MRICLVGGIFGKPGAYREAVTHTPETILADGLRGRGHIVVERGHAPSLELDGFDVIHVHHLASGALAAASSRNPIRLAFTPHWLRYDDRIRRRAARYVVARADAVVALSETEAAWQRGEYRRLGQRQHVIANGIDEQVFRFRRPVRPVSGEAWRLLYVGQLSKFKGVDHLLKALARIQDDVQVELLLVYQVASEEGSLQRLASQLGLSRVRFLGMRSALELAELYATSHALVLPSTGEALSTVISEALCVGRPVIATDVGAAREQVRTFGEVVPISDPDAFGAAVVRTLARYDDLAEYAPAASRRARATYSTSAMVQAHETMYSELVNREQRRPTVRARSVDESVGLGLQAWGRVRGGRR